LSGHVDAGEWSDAITLVEIKLCRRWLAGYPENRKGFRGEIRYFYMGNGRDTCSRPPAKDKKPTDERDV